MNTINQPIFQLNEEDGNELKPIKAKQHKNKEDT